MSFFTKFFGSKYPNYVIFYDYRQSELNENGKPIAKKITHFDLPTFAGDSAFVLNVCLYKSDILPSKWFFNILHQFVIFETNNHLFFSLEKDYNGIVLQMSDNIEDVVTKIEGKTRKTPGCFAKAKTIPCTLGSIFKWLYKSKAVYNTYNIISANCIHFVNQFFNVFKSK